MKLFRISEANYQPNPDLYSSVNLPIIFKRFIVCDKNWNAHKVVELDRLTFGEFGYLINYYEVIVNCKIPKLQDSAPVYHTSYSTFYIYYSLLTMNVGIRIPYAQIHEYNFVCKSMPTGWNVCCCYFLIEPQTVLHGYQIPGYQVVQVCVGLWATSLSCSPLW